MLRSSHPLLREGSGYYGFSAQEQMCSSMLGTNHAALCAPQVFQVQNWLVMDSLGRAALILDSSCFSFAYQYRGYRWQTVAEVWVLFTSRHWNLLSSSPSAWPCVRLINDLKTVMHSDCKSYVWGWFYTQYIKKSLICLWIKKGAGRLRQYAARGKVLSVIMPSTH